MSALSLSELIAISLLTMTIQFGSATLDMCLRCALNYQTAESAINISESHFSVSIHYIQMTHLHLWGVKTKKGQNEMNGEASGNGSGEKR